MTTASEEDICYIMEEIRKNRAFVAAEFAKHGVTVQEVCRRRGTLRRRCGSCRIAVRRLRAAVRTNGN